MTTANDSIDFLYQTLCQNQWKRIGAYPHHGFSTPLFSLYTKDSCGIGEYLDLIPMIEWAASMKMTVIQLLPLNDTGLDSSPYNSLSAFALNPLFLSLHALPDLDSELKDQLKDLQGLTSLDHVHYKNVMAKKEAFTKVYWQKYGQKIIAEGDYDSFVKDNPWLPGYALFRTLKERSGFVHFKDWPKAWRDPDHWPTLAQQESSNIEYHYFIQYLCHIQLKKVQAFALENKVHLMGDIPILMSPDSADVWQFPHLFHTDLAAGVPPDMFSPDGQYWGFPLYNWPAFEKENYRWWQWRLKKAENYFDIYRVDHIIGFFRIWAIRLKQRPIDGFFLPSDSKEWVTQGKAILSMMIESSSMLPIGEDLGTIPHTVRQCMHELGISGTKVMRWERDWQGDLSFLPISEYPLDSLCTVSTHDSDTLQLWWVNEKDSAIRYATNKGWTYLPELSYEHRFEILLDSHRARSLFHINLLQEYLALFPELTWPRPEHERINIPGTISPFNWSYRYRQPIEEIIKHKPLKEAMQKLIQ
ncbi:MAG: 4-alpha-glucanotransferase [Parachlamydiales bacterium]|nr:4-alpha-glucanotransferase [Parachlamydiales bacterium]